MSEDKWLNAIDAPPQTDELVAEISHCLSGAMLDT